MYYQATKGPIESFNHRLSLTASAVLAVAATAVILLSLLSYNSSTSYGKSPYIALPRRTASEPAVTRPVSQTATTGQNGPNAGGVSSSAGASGSLTTQTIGGRGGGTAPNSVTSPVPGSVSTSTTAPSTSPATSSGILPQTVTTPSTNLQAGGKTLLTTSPTTLTIN